LKLSEPSSLLPSLPRGAAILIARLRSLGDIVLETPSIAALHAWRPDLRISVLVEPRFAAVLEGNPAVAAIVLSRGFLETAAEVRRRRFPIAFNHHGGPRSALLTAASGAPARVCWKGFQFSFVYNVHVPDAAEFFGTPIVHTAEHRISQLYWTGLPRGPIPGARVFPQQDAREAVARILGGCGILPGTPYAVLQPGGRLKTMRWPAAKYAQIARWLRDAHGTASVVNLGGQDGEAASEARREMSDCSAIPEALSLREMIALIAEARIFVGNDSGPAHVAAAAGTPSAVIYGPTNPTQWRPWGSEHRVVETRATFRAIRGDKTVPASEPRPIQSIEVDEVRHACEELIRGKGHADNVRGDALKASGTA
jgi:lipopolysaccharide heptosyltransferase III